MEELCFILFSFLPLWVCFFLYCSLYPSFQISFFFSSHEIPTPAIPVHNLQSSLISSIIFGMLLWWPQVSQLYTWLLPHVSYKRWFVCIHLLICVSLSFVCFFGLLWSKYVGYLKNMCRIHNSFTFKEYHYFIFKSIHIMFILHSNAGLKHIILTETNTLYSTGYLLYLQRTGSHKEVSASIWPLTR